MMQQKLEQFYSSLWPLSLLAYVPAQPVYAEHVQISWSLPGLAKKLLPFITEAVVRAISLFSLDIGLP